MPSAHSITLVLLDDHALFRAGLSAMLDTGDGHFDVVAEAGSLGELAELEARPDVVVTDMVLPDGQGVDVIAAVRRQFADARLLVVSMVGDLPTVREAMNAGAHGYLLKDAASTELIDAIQAVAGGGDYVQPVLAVALARRPHEHEVVLSERERTVLRLIALGHSNAEIARTLHFSVRTIETERAAVSDKVGARSRAALVRYALDHRLLNGRAGAHR